jgi:hypothetical protein
LQWERNKRDMMLDRTEQQIRNLLISSPVKRQPSATQDDVLDRPNSKLYDLEKASKSYFDEPQSTDTLKRFVFDILSLSFNLINSTCSTLDSMPQKRQFVV